MKYVLAALAVLTLALGASRADDSAKKDDANKDQSKSTSGDAAKTDAGKGKAGKARRLNPETMFKKLDANGDGKVSKDEFAKFGEQGKMAERLKDKPGALEKLFSRLDTDGDGSLSLEEFKKFTESRRKNNK